MREDYALYLLEKTRQDYNKIADDFVQKRDWLPPDIKSLEQYLNPGESILDFGCAQGWFKKIAGATVDYLGVDVSDKLINIARQRYPEGKFLVIEQLVLPFEDDSFDKVFCLSVLHHIPSNKFRIKLLKEIRRVIKPRGKLILTVWNLKDQRGIGQFLFKYTLLKLLGKSKLDFKDIFYPWKNSQGRSLAERYIHIFSARELKKILKKSGFLIKESGILKRSKKGSNIFILAQKAD